MRVCAPPIKHPCYFGVDMPHKSELLANGRSLEQIRKFVGADSLGYLSIDSVKDVVALRPNSHRGFCDACFTGAYPMAVQLEMDKLALEHTLSDLNEPLALAD